MNAVRLGFIYTELHASGGEPNRVDRVVGSVPMKRGSYPEEVARAILWLLSNVKRGGVAARAGRVGLPETAPLHAVNVDCTTCYETIQKEQRMIGSREHS